MALLVLMALVVLALLVEMFNGLDDLFV